MICFIGDWGTFHKRKNLLFYYILMLWPRHSDYCKCHIYDRYPSRHCISTTIYKIREVDLPYARKMSANMNNQQRPKVESTRHVENTILTRNRPWSPDSSFNNVSSRNIYSVISSSTWPPHELIHPLTRGYLDLPVNEITDVIFHTHIPLSIAEC